MQHGRASVPRVRAVLGRHPIGYLFVAPFVAFFALVFAYPLGFAVYMSVHDYFFAAPGAHVDRPFVGLENYRQLLHDPELHAALGHIAQFLLINVPISVVTALLVATALNTVRWRLVFGTAFYVPYVTSAIAVVAAWIVLLSGDGLVSALLGPAAPTPSWLVNQTWALPVIALVVSWKWLGFYILVYLAALQAVPNELYDAAAIDGSGAVRRFWHVTVPGVRGATVIVLVISIINSANLFNEPFLLTGGGGPNGATTTPVLLMYQQGIEQGHVGYAAAIGVALTLLVVAVSAMSGGLIERRDR